MKQSYLSNQTQTTSSSNNKWMMSLVPAIAMGALAFAFWGRPVASPINFVGATIPAQDNLLPISATLVVGENSAAKPLTLRGRLTVFNPQIIASPASGMVARLLVQPGQIVKAGDTIAMISDQSVPAVEKSRIAIQQRAAATQQAATNQQNILQGKLAQEKILLKAAHQRVDKAAKQLTYSRDLLRRLQNGEKIPKSKTDNQDVDTKSVPPLDPTPENKKDAARSAAALAQAQQEKKHTAKVATQKWQILHVLLTRQLAAKATPANANSNNAQPSAPTQDQIDSARADAKAAQDAADKARMKAFKLGNEKSVVPPSKAVPSTPSNPTKSTYITTADATQIANAALKESRAALAQVDAIQKQIQRYQAPVQSATTNFQAATSNLEHAQQSLFDNPPKVPMTPVIARSGGMVQALAVLATHVGQGDKIASVVAPNLLKLEVRDSSGSWKHLAVNSRFTVNVQTSADDKNVTPTDARLVSITPPTQTGQPSILHIQVFNPVAQSTASKKSNAADEHAATKAAAPTRKFSPGMTAICSIPRADAAINIPRTALRKNGSGQYQVAVLKPVSAQPQKFSIQWNHVSIKSDDGSSANVVISSGLNQGDRIALQPEAMYTLGVAGRFPATVQIAQK